jgi:hypothetical protein
MPLSLSAKPSSNCTKTSGNTLSMRKILLNRVGTAMHPNNAMKKAMLP